MAITARQIITNSDGTDANSYNTASVSLLPQKLYLLAVSSRRVGGIYEPTVTGASRTWTKVATKTFIDGDGRITLFRSLADSSNSGALTIDFAGQTQLRCGWSLSEFSNVDTSGTNGANAIVQHAENNGADPLSSLSISLSPFGSTLNATYGSIFVIDIASTISAGSGFSELGQSAVEILNVQSQWKNTNDTTVDWSWTTGAGVEMAAGIAVELKHALVGSGFFNFF